MIDVLLKNPGPRDMEERANKVPSSDGTGDGCNQPLE
jgi:hypothetical protein